MEKITEKPVIKLISYRYYVFAILGGICLIFGLLKFTYRTRANLLSLARQAILPCVVRNQRTGHARPHQVSSVEFQEIEGERDFVSVNGAPREVGRSRK